MEITQEQRTWARVAGICFLAKYVFEGFGDSITIIALRGQPFETIAAYAAANYTLWRFCLLNVVIAWITTGFLAFALYVVLEPVHKRLSQLALVLRLGACFVGATAMMMRFGHARVLKAIETPGVFTIDQLRTLAQVVQRSAGEGIETAWIFQGAGEAIFFLLLLRSRFVPAWVAWLGIFGSAVLVVASGVMIVFPQLINQLKLLGLAAVLAEVVTAVILIRGLPRRAAAEARA